MKQNNQPPALLKNTHCLQTFDGEIRVSTLDIFKRLDYKNHRHLKRVIERYTLDFLRMGFMPFKSHKPQQKSPGGRPDKSYFLNESQFLFLISICKNSSNTIDLQIRLIKEFKVLRTRQEKALINNQPEVWQLARADGKVLYLKKSVTVKKFIDYAILQGSTNADKYYRIFDILQKKRCLLYLKPLKIIEII